MKKRKITAPVLVLLSAMILIQGCIPADQQVSAPESPESVESKPEEVVKEPIENEEKRELSLFAFKNLKHQDIIDEVSYSKELFNEPPSTSWQIEEDRVYLETNPTAYLQPFETKYSVSSSIGNVLNFKTTKDFQLFSGPVIDAKNQRIYIQVRSNTREGMVNIPDETVILAYDIPSENISILREPILSGVNALSRVDDQGLVYIDSVRTGFGAFGGETVYDGTGFDPKNLVYSIDYGFEASQQTVEYEQKVGEKTELKISIIGKDEIANLPLGETSEEIYQQITLPEASKSIEIEYPNPVSEGGESVYISNSVVSSKDNKYVAFIYYDSVYLISIDQKEIQKFSDEELSSFVKNAYELNRPKECWHNSRLFIYNETDDSTFVFIPGEDSYQINNGDQIPQECSVEFDQYENNIRPPQIG